MRLDDTLGSHDDLEDGLVEEEYGHVGFDVELSDLVFEDRGKSSVLVAAYWRENEGESWIFVARSELERVRAVDVAFYSPIVIPYPLHGQPQLHSSWPNVVYFLYDLNP